MINSSKLYDKVMEWIRKRTSTRSIFVDKSGKRPSDGKNWLILSSKYPKNKLSIFRECGFDVQEPNNNGGVFISEPKRVEDKWCCGKLPQ